LGRRPRRHRGRRLHRAAVAPHAERGALRSSRACDDAAAYRRDSGPAHLGSDPCPAPGDGWPDDGVRPHPRRRPDAAGGAVAAPHRDRGVAEPDRGPAVAEPVADAEGPPHPAVEPAGQGQAHERAGTRLSAALGGPFTTVVSILRPNRGTERRRSQPVLAHAVTMIGGGVLARARRLPPRARKGTVSQRVLTGHARWYCYLVTGGAVFALLAAAVPRPEPAVAFSVGTLASASAVVALLLWTAAPRITRSALWMLAITGTALATLAATTAATSSLGHDPEIDSGRSTGM